MSNKAMAEGQAVVSCEPCKGTGLAGEDFCAKCEGLGVVAADGAAAVIAPHPLTEAEIAAMRPAVTGDSQGDPAEHANGDGGVEFDEPASVNGMAPVSGIADARAIETAEGEGMMAKEPPVRAWVKVKAIGEAVLRERCLRLRTAVARLLECDVQHVAVDWNATGEPIVVTSVAHRVGKVQAIVNAVLGAGRAESLRPRESSKTLGNSEMMIFDVYEAV